MKKILALILATFMTLAFVAACGNGGGNGGGDEAPAADGGDADLPIVLLLGSNFGDRSFFDSAAGGIDRLREELGDQVETRIIDVGEDTTRWQAAVLDASEAENPDIVIVGTFNMVEPLQVAAAANPHINYAIFDDRVDGFDNVHSFMFRVNEGSFLAGMIAAEASETGIIGFVGGMDNTPTIWDFLLGYIEGAQYVNPDIQVVVSYTNDFRDSARGKELALAQINNNNVDVIFSVAGGAGAGVIEAAAESQIYVIGVDGDQAAQYEGRPEQEWIITSSLKHVGNGIFSLVERTLVDSFPAGHIFLGLEDGAVGVIIDDNTRRVVSEDFLERVAQTEQDIISGAVTVTSAWEVSEQEVAAIIASAR